MSKKGFEYMGLFEPCMHAPQGSVRRCSSPSELVTGKGKDSSCNCYLK